MPNQSKPKTDSKSSHPKTIEEALARFQMEHHAAGKDGKANYGTYTTLAGGLNAVQPATHLGLSHTQTFEHIVVGEKVVTVFNPDYFLLVKTILTTQLLKATYLFLIWFLIEGTSCKL